MLAILANRAYRHLFAAQVTALLGTGLMTVALALLAYELAGDNAGAVLGTALAIKMIAYVLVAPVVGDLAGRLPRRAFLVSLDIVRAAVALALPFVDQVWQVYVLIALLQSASAAFTPTFQATIPDILPDEDDYTRALSLSRLAYDLENLVSPALAAALVALIGFHWLFGGTVIGFLVSAALVVSVSLPRSRQEQGGLRRRRLGKGIGIYLATPRLRALLALNLAIAAGGALVIVNTVVYVQSAFTLGESHTAIALAAFGGGSMLAALLLPKLLKNASDRRVMIAGGGLLAAGSFAAAFLDSYAALLAVWFALGTGYALAQTPSGRLLRRSAREQDRPTIFAAQFALSHACWLITYPVAGWLGASAGLAPTALVLAALAAAGLALAALFWPVPDKHIMAHEHPDLPPEHPHLQEGKRLSPSAHVHAYVIDDLHVMWPQAR